MTPGVPPQVPSKLFQNTRIFNSTSVPTLSQQPCGMDVRLRVFGLPLRVGVVAWWHGGVNVCVKKREVLLYWTPSRS